VCVLLLQGLVQLVVAFEDENEAFGWIDEQTRAYGLQRSSGSIVWDLKTSQIIKDVQS
jgi:hypothetical protein